MFPSRWSPSLVAAVAAAALLACRTAPRGAAPDPLSCVVVGSTQSPADVRIYDSDPYNPPPVGTRLFLGTINYRERIRIHSATGRIWWAFRGSVEDMWREGNEAACRDGQVVQVP